MKKIFTYFLGFILSIFIFLLAILLIFSQTVFKKSFTLNALEKNNYYEKTYGDIRESFNNYIMQSGLDESILDNLYSIEKIKQDVNNVVNSIYENEQINTNTQDIKAELDSRIYKILEENNRKIESEEKKAIESFENTIVETYANGISFSKKTIEQVGSVFTKISSLIIKAEIIIAIAVVLILIIIYALNKRDAFKYFGISLLTSGILFLLIKFLVGNRVAYITILNTTFSEILRYLINTVINTCFIVGIIFIIIGILENIFINKNNSLKDK